MTVIENRLAQVRAHMADADYDALIIPRADEYLGEYIPPTTSACCGYPALRGRRGWS